MIDEFSTESDELLRDAAVEDARLAESLAGLRDTFDAPPAGHVRARHLQMMLEALPAATGESAPARQRRSWSRKAVIAVLVPAATLAIVGMLAGLSYAHVVTLPRPIRQVFDAFGMNLPEPPPAAQTAQPPAGPAPARTTAPSTRVTTPKESGTTSSSHPQPQVIPSGHGDNPSGNGHGDNSGGNSGGDSPTNPGTSCNVPAPLCGA